MDQGKAREAQMRYPNSVMHREPFNRPPIARNANASYFIRPGNPSFMENVVTAEIVLDISSGAGVTSFGHSCNPIKDALIEQIGRMPYHHAGQWTSEIVERAGSAIIERCGSNFKGGGVSFYSGGSEAIEAALKCAGQILSNYQAVTPIIARKHSYHGNTLGALLVSDHPRKAKVINNLLLHEIVPDGGRFDAFMPSWLSIPDHCMSDYERECIASLGKSLARMKVDYNARSIVIIETIGGTTLGIEPPTTNYLAGVRAMCDAYGAVLIHDEILSGNYRTGFLLASQYYRASDPDIVVLGKGITGGYFPMSAVVVSSGARRVMELAGKLWHTSTNQNHPTGCAAVLAAMQQYDELTDKIRRLARHLTMEVVPHLRTLPQVHSVNGVGTLWGIRFDPDVPDLHLTIKAKLSEEGMACYTDGGTVEGRGNMLLLAPDCSWQTHDADMLVEALGTMKLEQMFPVG